MSDQRYRSRLISLRSQINANFDRLIGQASLANEDQEGSLIERYFIEATVKQCVVIRILARELIYFMYNPAINVNCD